MARREVMRVEFLAFAAFAAVVVFALKFVGETAQGVKEARDRRWSERQREARACREDESIRKCEQEDGDSVEFSGGVVHGDDLDLPQEIGTSGGVIDYRLRRLSSLSNEKFPLPEGVRRIRYAAPGDPFRNEALWQEKDAEAGRWITLPEDVSYKEDPDTGEWIKVREYYDDDDELWRFVWDPDVGGWKPDARPRRELVVRGNKRVLWDRENTTFTTIAEWDPNTQCWKRVRGATSE